MQNKQKGQSIIEFALVLPLFLLLVFGLFYIGMFFADYLTLSSIARSSAREAAIIPSKDYYQDNYKKVRDKYGGQHQQNILTLNTIKTAKMYKLS